MPEAIERHLEVARTARYWVLGEDSARPAELWIVLHGYQQLARRFLRRFEPLADGRRRIVAPEALSRFYKDQAPGRHGPDSAVGASWMTREDREREIADYVRYLDRLAEAVGAGATPDGEEGRGGAAPPALTVLGFSQGVATAARWSVLGRTRPRRLVLWGDFLPADLDVERAREAWAGTEVILVRGDRDALLGDERTAEVEASLLSAAAPSARTVRYAGGHDIHQPTLRALASGS